MIDTLREQRNGRLVDELTTKLAKVIAAVQSTGKMGQVTMTLKLKPRPGTDGKQIEVEDIVKISVPEPSKSTTVFYAKGDQLLREDPDQRSFEGLEIVNPEQERSTS